VFCKIDPRGDRASFSHLRRPPSDWVSERRACRARDNTLWLFGRATGLSSAIDKNRPDYTVYCGGWEVGRIYQTRGGPDSLRWFWSMNANDPMTRSGRVETLEEAKAQFQKNWRGSSARSPSVPWGSYGRTHPFSSQPASPTSDTGTAAPPHAHPSLVNRSIRARRPVPTQKATPVVSAVRSALRQVRERQQGQDWRRHWPG
jgi:hypothetical protein